MTVIRGLDPGDPQLIGPYRLIGQLGHGGMGRVFLGLSAGGRPVAVKVIRAELAEDPEFRISFRREVASARRVSGLFTALVLDADVDGPVPWLATAYVPGPSLAEAVAARGPMPAGRVLGLAAGLAESLTAIHAACVVHCDLKPSNVLLAQDGPRVIDFGISRAAEAAVTLAGLLAGSPGYMSPEQALGREVGPPGDVFSLGAVLAFAATGRGPFGGGSAPEVAYRVVYGAPDLGGLPGRLRPLVERCLAKDPRERPAAPDLLAQVGDVQQAAVGLAGSPARALGGWPADAGADSFLPPSVTEPGRRPRRPVPALAAAWAGGAILAAAAVAGLTLTGGTRSSLATQDHPGTPAAGASVSPGTRAASAGPGRASSPAAGAIPAADALPVRRRSPSAGTSSSPSASPAATRPRSPSPSPTPSQSTSPFPLATGSPPTVFPFVSSSPGSAAPAPRSLAACRRPVPARQRCA